MGRPRAFQRDDALQQALEVFWVQGYDATSMSDLQRALGIGRQSLYNTFGDKDQLFEEALERYVQRTDQMLDDDFGPDSDLETLRAHFHQVVLRVTEGEPRRGCLLMSTTMARSPHDERIAKLTARALEGMRAAYTRALRNAQARQQVSAEADVEAVATMLTSQSAGLAVLARGGASVEDLHRAAAAALAAIR